MNFQSPPDPPSSSSRSPRSLFWVACCFVLLACSGKVTETGDVHPTPGGAGGSDSGTDAPGGSGGTGVAGVGGTGVGGTVVGGDGGGGMGGTAGGPGGTGATGGQMTDGGCPDLPSCNWCGGVTIYDEQGCAVGYQCGNGADPCSTQPCDPASLTGCGAGWHCEADSLCWPGSACGEKTCTTPNWNCDCEWSCPDGNLYSYYCVALSGGGQSCECSVNGQVTHGCAENVGSAGGPGDWCGQPNCCELPW